jgi:hypothetical protein
MCYTTAAIGALAGFVFAMVLLVFFLHALLNLVACLIFLPARVRPRTFAVALSAVAVAVYGLAFWNGAAAIRALQALKLRYPFESLDGRLAFERNRQPAIAETGRVPLSRVVASNLAEFDEQLDFSYVQRAWALRDLHENTYRHFARAAGFGVMRMRSVSEYVLKLEPRSKIVMPLLIDLPELNPPRKQLLDKHREVMLDFLEPDRLGYFRAPRLASGFESHGFSQLGQQLSRGSSDAHWQVTRLELVSLLRHDEPRVYVSAVVPRMDELAGVPHRRLDSFENSALPELQSREDVVVALEPERIRMLGAIRAGKKCLDCHDGQRGDLLGAFSYEIAPAPAGSDSVVAKF